LIDGWGRKTLLAGYIVPRIKSLRKR